jgi:hypothetical protein
MAPMCRSRPLNLGIWASAYRKIQMHFKLALPSASRQSKGISGEFQLLQGSHVAWRCLSRFDIFREIR